MINFRVCGRVISGLSLIVLMTSCNAFSKTSCRISPDCLVSGHGIIFGGSLLERYRAQRKLDQAASTFTEWTGRSAPFGVISLRNAATFPFSATIGSQWVLQFDVTETKRVEKGLSRAIASGGIVKLPYNDEVASYEDGDLSHEVCHKYVEQLALSVGARQSVSDMINEAAAISCEPPRGRARQLAGYYLGGSQHFSAVDVFTVRNPLSINQGLLLRAGLPIRDKGTHTVSFFIEPASGLSRDVAAYYYKSAALQEYLRRNRSFGLEAIGRLVIASAKGVSLQDWLSTEHSNGLPVTESAFSNAVNATSLSILARGAPTARWGH